MTKESPTPETPPIKLGDIQDFSQSNDAIIQRLLDQINERSYAQEIKQKPSILLSLTNVLRQHYIYNQNGWKNTPPHLYSLIEGKVPVRKLEKSQSGICYFIHIGHLSRVAEIIKLHNQSPADTLPPSVRPHVANRTDAAG